MLFCIQERKIIRHQGCVYVSLCVCVSTFMFTCTYVHIAAQIYAYAHALCAELWKRQIGIPLVVSFFWKLEFCLV